MNTTGSGPVVVGIDSTEGATTATRYAAWEAQRRGVGLRLIYAHQPTPMWGPGTFIADDYAWDAGWVSDLLSSAKEKITSDCPDLDVEAVAAAGGAAGVLVRESAQASLIVVASRARGGFGGHLAGSISAQVAAHAASPVVVLRNLEPHYVDPETFAGRPVVVGLDGSAESQHAIGFAVEEALARRAELHAVYVWDVLDVRHMGPASLETYNMDVEETKVGRLLAEATAGWVDRYPGLVIQCRPVHAPDAVDVLSHPALGAGLVVVGSRGHGGFLGLRLGSTVDGLIRHSPAPVAVVRGHRDDPR